MFAKTLLSVSVILLALAGCASMPALFEAQSQAPLREIVDDVPALMRAIDPAQPRLHGERGSGACYGNVAVYIR